MLKATLKYYGGKLIKPLSVALPLNLLIGLVYCLLTDKMAVESYSNVLAVIGGAYLAIGGMGFMGGMFSESDYNQNFSRSANQRRADNSSRSTFNVTVLMIGVSTMLVSFAVLVFQ